MEIMKKLLSRILFLVFIGFAWEFIYRCNIFTPLLFPSLQAILDSLLAGIMSGELIVRTLVTLGIIFQGLCLGIIVALFLTGLSQINKLFYEIVDNLVFIMNPIPGMAIYPLCVLLFGIGRDAMLFIIVHSVVWGLLINVLAGIKAIPHVHKEVALNFELNKIRTIKDIYIPASMTYVIPGIRAAFARAWRTTISVEIIAGVLANNSGLGWIMTYQRNTLDIAGLYSTIIMIIIVGIVIEEAIFKTAIRLTIEKWGNVQ